VLEAAFAFELGFVLLNSVLLPVALSKGSKSTFDSFYHMFTQGKDPQSDGEALTTVTIILSIIQGILFVLGSVLQLTGGLWFLLKMKKKREEEDASDIEEESQTLAWVIGFA